MSKESPWINYKEEYLLKQKVIFTDIIQASWQYFRTEAETRNQLAQAGFEIIDVIYDNQKMFPTIISQRRV